MARTSHLDSLNRRPQRRPVRALAILALVVALLLAGLAFLRRGAPASLHIESALDGVGPRTPVTITANASARGVVRLEVEAVQGDTVDVLYTEDLPRTPWWAFWSAEQTTADAEVVVGRDVQEALRPGELLIRARAVTAGSPLGGDATADAEITLPVRLTPPPISSAAEPDVVTQGGAGVAVYTVDAASVRDGVEVGDLFFPGHDLPDSGTTPGNRFAFFAVPHDVDDASRVRLVAEDDLGNVARRPFLTRFTPKPVKEDDIRVGDGFLADVVPEIQSHTPSLQPTGDPVADYVAINRDLRRENQAHLRTLGADSGTEFLWSKPFLQLPSSRVMAGFGERRTYFYGEREIDRQTHLGYDLASVRRAPVPAAARGRVMLAEFFGIYGNTVVLDHGHGLMTLYSHLSSIDAVVGETLERGAILGRTGATGLAGGDHLHFTVMIRGVQVDPLEWLDRRWIETRIVAKLGDALPWSP